MTNTVDSRDGRRDSTSKHVRGVTLLVDTTHQMPVRRAWGICTNSATEGQICAHLACIHQNHHHQDTVHHTWLLAHNYCVSSLFWATLTPRLVIAGSHTYIYLLTLASRYFGREFLCGLGFGHEINRATGSGNSAKHLARRGIPPVTALHSSRQQLPQRGPTIVHGTYPPSHSQVQAASILG